MSEQEFQQDQQPNVPQEGSEEQSFEDGPGAGESDFVIPQEKQPLSKGTVAMFVVIAAVGAGAYFMYARSGPQSAMAADPKAQQVIKQYMNDRNKNPAALKQMLSETEAKMKQFLNYPNFAHIDLRSNPFKMVADATDTAPVRHDDGFDKRRREEERNAAIKAVSELQLQSVMVSGTRKCCMINNTLYQEGQQVGALTIEQIETNRVIVRTGNFRFELSTQRQ